MKRWKMNRRSFVLILALLVLLASIALSEEQAGANPRVRPKLGHTNRSASTGVGYDLSWWTVDGGSVSPAVHRSGYTLGGTAGQPDSAVWAGGGTTLAGGFWAGVEATYRIYLPLAMRGG
jgi:hypothetical protein